MDPTQLPFESTSVFDAAAAADPSLAPSEGISAIVARIHERAVQLANEQDALREAEEELEAVQTSLVSEQQRSQRVRTKYLKSTIQANSMELECCKLQDLIAERESKTKKLRQRERLIVEQIAKHDAEWVAVVEGTLVQHKVRQEIYQKHLQGAINARKVAMARRNFKLETAARLAAQLQRDRESILQEQQQVQAFMMRMTETEDEANKEVEDLALQVRSSLAKRSELRTLLREAQQAYQNARDEADSLGHEYRNCRV